VYFVKSTIEETIMNQQLRVDPQAAGFSLLELIIALAITLSVLAISSTLLVSGFRLRTRENSASDAVADVQRALNIMSREIGNAGFRLNTNGIVATESDASHIRIRSNLNALDTTASTQSRNNVIDAGEDVMYSVNVATGTDYLVRWDQYAANQKTVLANRLDSLRIHYFAQKVTYSTAVPTSSTNGCADVVNPSSAEVAPNLAGYIVLAVCVQLPAVGVKNSAGYVPASNALLVSDVTLRNANLATY
jgi:prepilin-type N-terminal cleavage/methylation domain-containing protein